MHFVATRQHAPLLHVRGRLDHLRIFRSVSESVDWSCGDNTKYEVVWAAESRRPWRSKVDASVRGISPARLTPAGAKVLGANLEMSVIGSVTATVTQYLRRVLPSSEIC